MENNRKKKHTDLEVVPVGFANGISTQLAKNVLCTEKQQS